jgi:hypothetical protein
MTKEMTCEAIPRLFPRPRCDNVDLKSDVEAAGGSTAGEMEA